MWASAAIVALVALQTALPREAAEKGDAGAQWQMAVAYDRAGCRLSVVACRRRAPPLTTDN